MNKHAVSRDKGGLESRIPSWQMGCLRRAQVYKAGGLRNVEEPQDAL